LSALGRHIIAELYGCPPPLLEDAAEVEAFMVEAAKAAGATIIGSHFHHFSPYGVSGVVVIAESHLAIHTWPEYGYAAADFFTCGPHSDPHKAAEVLKSLIKAEHVVKKEMERGSFADLPKQVAPGLTSMQAAEKVTPQREVWLTEQAHGFALSVKHVGGILHKEQSPFQKIEVIRTAAFGKALVLDGRIAITEGDEAAYHEMLVHVPMCSHPKPQNVLLLGGGDGAAVRELLKHPTVESITVIEQDAAIPETMARFFPKLHRYLSHPKVQLLFGKAGAHMASMPPHQFDVVLMDLENVAFPASLERNKELLDAIRPALRPNGVCGTLIGSPHVQPQTFAKGLSLLEATWSKGMVSPYLVWLPTSPSGVVALACAGTELAIHQPDAARQSALCAKHPLNYYSADVHQAALVLPPFVMKLL